MSVLKAAAFPFRFDGRLRRSTTWTILFTATGLYLLVAAANEVSQAMEGLFWFSCGLWLWVTLAALARRYHDLGQHGATALLCFIPPMCLVAWMSWGFSEGHPSPNPYGPSPKAPPRPWLPGSLYDALPEEDVL